MTYLITILAPFIIGINGIILIVNAVIDIRKEKRGKTAYEEIKEKWEKVS